MENGWYLIKLNRSSEIERHLPPSRCIYIEDGVARVRHANATPECEWFQFIATGCIESKAFAIGKPHEFSDNGEYWIRDEYAGYGFEREYPHISGKGPGYKFCREIEEPKIEITVKIGGEEVPLGPEFRDLIQAFINSAREIPGVKSSNPDGL